MRIFIDWKETVEELKREFAEMGILVKPKSMQNKDIEGNPDYFTKELQHYSYTLLNPNPDDIIQANKEWANAEFAERIAVERINPGTAYLKRDEVWDEFLEDGKFGYTYNERFGLANQLSKIIARLSVDPDSRQLWLSVWSPERDIDKLGGISRVPCSLGYNFQIRNGKLNIHYVMRSCDFYTHFYNDVYLALKLQRYVAESVGVPVGDFTHTMFSFHVYNKDLEGVF